MQWLAQWHIGAVERLHRALSRHAAPGVPAHLAIGEEGEDAAFFYLRRKGFVIVARRWSSGSVPGDIDLIAWDGSVLCFVEVKTRTARDLTPAEAAVDEHKRNTLRRLARHYVRHLDHTPAPQFRFDVVSVYLEPGKPRVLIHFPAAFPPRGYRADFP